MIVDLKRKDSSEYQTLMDIICTKADVLLDPFRPGVMEKLGFGPSELSKKNPGLIYVRLSGYGQTGQMAKKAGHELNFLSLSGVLSVSFLVNYFNLQFKKMLGKDKEPPTIPLNLIGDLSGGSLLCITRILLALMERQSTGKGQVIDHSITEGTMYLSSYLHDTMQSLWSKPRGGNVLDGGAPFYNVYEAKCGGYMAVAAVEPKFFDTLITILQTVVEAEMNERLERLRNSQMDKSEWAAMSQTFRQIFLLLTRKEWERVFDNVDCCVTPVLTMTELHKFKHHMNRNAIENITLDNGQNILAPKSPFGSSKL